INLLGQKAAAVHFDAENFLSINSFIESVKQTLQHTFKTNQLNSLINNAGVGATIPIQQATEKDFDRLLNIHFKSVYFLTQGLLPILADGGSILNISTGTTRFCVPGYSIYSSMKSAIETFTKYVAKENGQRGIRANVVAPGPVETDFNQAAIRSNPQMKSFLSGLSPLNRVGYADDIGGVVAFLCSEHSKWINGQRIEVSGGINL
ncbi:MAG: SDR family oxidoreductase, partial [Cyclobacteriaceae bacterium]|nr:SDR family oxidoreductase [Cyclobacteriaceae bacterium]